MVAMEALVVIGDLVELLVAMEAGAALLVVQNRAGVVAVLGHARSVTQTLLGQQLEQG